MLGALVRVYRPRPESEWLRSGIPEQRIISEELWNMMEARRESGKRLYGDANRHSGLMHTQRNCYRRSWRRTDRQREVSEITERVVSPSKDSIKTQIAAMRTTAKSELKDLRSLLGGDVTGARTALLNHGDGSQMRAEGKVHVAKEN